MNNSQLTAKQLNIINLLHRFRFLTSSQIQKFLNNKTTRLANYYLKTLNTQNYIGKHYTRTLGEGNQPAVYYLTTGSIKALEVNPDIQKAKLKYIYREKIRSKQFISHALFIVDYHLYLVTESTKSNHQLHFFTKTDLQAHPYIIHPLPDAYFARVDTAGETKRYFVEVIDEGAPRFALRKRIEQYNDYIESGRFEKVTTHTFPTILFICPTIGIMIYLKKHLGRIYEETSLDQVDIYLATQEGAFSSNWEKIEAVEE
ncbi:MAG: replication-relaxation family protein [Candidatus Microgenomates bacterium]|jgi:hypothetical protein